MVVDTAEDFGVPIRMSWNITLSPLMNEMAPGGNLGTMLMAYHSDAWFQSSCPPT